MMTFSRAVALYAETEAAIRQCRLRGLKAWEESYVKRLVSLNKLVNRKRSTVTGRPLK